MNLSSSPTDEELMQAVGTGDMGALGELVHRHQDRVLMVAYRVVLNWDLAEEVAQETFLHVHAAAPGYRASARFATWLYRVVVNASLDALRQRQRQPRPLAPEWADSLAEDLPDAVELRDRADHVVAAIGKLPERQRIALVLHFYEGLRYREVAEATGWSMSAVESLLGRAYAGLRQSLAGLAPGSNESRERQPPERLT